MQWRLRMRPVRELCEITAKHPAHPIPVGASTLAQYLLNVE